MMNKLPILYFFRPKLRKELSHTEPNIRAMAIEKVNNQSLLQNFALTDTSAIVREYAIQNLEDRETLVEISRNDKEKHVRIAADKRLRTLNIIGSAAPRELSHSEPNIRAMAIKKVNDQSLLQDFALTDTSAIVRKYAIQNLEDRETLVEISQKDKDKYVRIAADKRLAALKNKSKAQESKINARVKRLNKTRLRNALNLGNTHLLKELISEGCNLNAKVEDGLPPLFIAAKNNDIRIAEILVENGANIHFANAQGSSLFSGLCYYGNVEIVNIFLNRGMRKNYIDDAMSMAAIGGHAKIVELLITHGGNIEYISGDKSYTPLMFAIAEGHIDAVRVLVRHGANLNIKTDDEWTPYNLAVVHGHLEIARLLVESGARRLC